MANMSREDELFLQFTDARWDRMDREQRLSTMQEMENLVAAQQGRSPRTVKIFVPNEKINERNTNGYFQGDSIYMNPAFFTGKASRIPGIGKSGMMALNTLLHEGRHAWQWDYGQILKIEGIQFGA